MQIAGQASAGRRRSGSRASMFCLGVPTRIGDTRLLTWGGRLPGTDRGPALRARGGIESFEAPAPRIDARRECAMAGRTQLMDKLRELARNLWWTWQPNVIALFRELDPRSGGRSTIIRSSSSSGCRSSNSSGGRRRWRWIRGSTTPSAGWPNTSRTPIAGGRCTPRSCGPGRWRTSRPSSACTRACRSTRAAWACWPATTSRAPATWGSR